MIIYKAENLKNGKLYIGKSIYPTLDKRLEKHKETALYYPKKMRISTAIAKYGMVNFKWSIIDRAIDKEELARKETYWILHYRSNEPEFGYNVISGERNFPTMAGSSIYTGVMKTSSNHFSMAFRHGNVSIVKIFTEEEVAAQTYDKLHFFFARKDVKFVNFPERYAAYSIDEIKKDVAYLLDGKRFRGISKTANRWCVRSRFRYKEINSRSFATEEEAAECYDKITLHLRGIDYPHLNFPDKREQYAKENLENYYYEVTKKREEYSKHRGIGFHKKANKWFARYRGKIWLGVFSTEQEAINALNKYKEKVST